MSVSSRDEPTTNDGPMTAGVHIPPPLFFLGPLALGMLVHHTWPVRLLPRTVPACTLGSVLAVGSAVLLVWSLRTMYRVLAQARARASRVGLPGSVSQSERHRSRRRV